MPLRAGENPRMKRLLMIAFHFPPLEGSSGIQRTLRFVQQLPEFGWHPIVLTAHPVAYEHTSDDLLADVPSSVPVHRALALDAARHLSVKGRYPGRLAVPDRWMSWRLDGVRRGLQLIRKLRPDALWSTYPIATAHTIGAALQARSGLPWVADFRDPMTQADYPSDVRTRDAYRAIEQRVMQQAAACVFTTPGALAHYRQHHPDAAAKLRVIENGYDESSFDGLVVAPPQAAGPLVLLHSGAVYPSERDPTSLLDGLGRWRRKRGTGPQDLRIRFRAPVHDEVLTDLASRFGVADLVEIAGPVPYREALTEMMGAGALLVLQAANCNQQIPAKLYEYLRCGRPVVGLTDVAGDTARVLRDAGVPYTAPLDDTQAIERLFDQLLDEWRTSSLRLPDQAFIASASRHARASNLADLLGLLCTRELTIPTRRALQP